MRTISRGAYEQLLARSEIIEQDRHGVKVVRLPDGDYLKTFWYRHLFSSRRIYPEWLRFTLHVRALKRRGIATVDYQEAVRLPHLRRTGVIYRPLPGRTLRQVHAAGAFDTGLVARLGAFFALLHGKGVLFRSLHLGNVVLCPDGRFGLIDVADMRLVPWSLGKSSRLRNFIHLFRYPDDLKIVTLSGFPEFVEGYLMQLDSSTLRRSMEQRLRSLVDLPDMV